jgi:RNA polymerase sigma-70 factor (ECF subfamily)
MPETTGPDRVLATVRPLVVQYCRDRLGARQGTWESAEDADDVVQDVCLALVKALPGQPAKRPLSKVVRGIARHEVDAAYKAAARRKDEPVAEIPDEAGAAPDPELQALRHELTERMAQLLQAIPEKQREIVVLRIVVGLTAEETAAVVGSTPGAVRVAQHRALGHLRKTLTAPRA